MIQKLINKYSDADTNEILTKGFSFLLIRIGGLLAGYLFTYFVAKYYGASVYGLVSLCFSLFLIFGIIGRLGLDINLVKFYSQEEHRDEKGLFYRVWVKSFLASSCLALLLYFFKDLLVYRLFNKPQLSSYIFWIAAAIPFWSSTLICAGLMRAKKHNGWFAILNNPGRYVLSLAGFFCKGS